MPVAQRSRSTHHGAESTPGGQLLVVGAGGFLGNEIVRCFASRGWKVRGLVRNPASRDRVRAAGGEAVLGDVLDVPSLKERASGCDAIIHVASNPAEGVDQPELVRKVRVQGTANLVEAARFCQVRRLVVGSGYWVYAGQTGTITEESRVDPQGESRINYEAEREGLVARTPPGPEVLVARPGMVYGDGSWFRSVVDGIQDGTYRVIDGGSNSWSFVSLPDTASGFFAVVTAGRAGEVYNIVDGSPSSWIDFARLVAERLGRPAPSSQSFASAVDAYGRAVATHLSANRAVSSAKLTSLGWVPTFPHFREGIETLLPRMNPHPG